MVINENYVVIENIDIVRLYIHSGAYHNNKLFNLCTMILGLLELYEDTNKVHVGKFIMMSKDPICKYLIYEYEKYVKWIKEEYKRNIYNYVQEENINLDDDNVLLLEDNKLIECSLIKENDAIKLVLGDNK